MTFIIVVVMSTERKRNAECVNVQMELNRISKESWREPAILFDSKQPHLRCIPRITDSDTLQPVIAYKFL